MIEKRGLDIDIEMDGGISEKNVKEVTEAGVNVVVSGNTIFSAKDPAAMIRTLKRTP